MGYKPEVIFRHAEKVDNSTGLVIMDLPFKIAPLGINSAQSIINQFQYQYNSSNRSINRAYEVLRDNNITELITPAKNLFTDPDQLKNFSPTDLPAYPFIIVHNDYQHNYDNTGHSNNFTSNNAFTSNIYAGIRIMISPNHDKLIDAVKSGKIGYNGLVHPKAHYNGEKGSGVYFYYTGYNLYDNFCANPQMSPGSYTSVNFDPNGTKEGGAQGWYSKKDIYYPRHGNSSGGPTEYVKFLTANTFTTYTNLTNGEINELIDFAISPGSAPEPVAGLAEVRNQGAFILGKYFTKNEDGTVLYALTNRVKGISNDECKYWFAASGSFGIPNGLISFEDILKKRKGRYQVQNVTIEDDTQSIVEPTFTFTGRVVRSGSGYNPNKTENLEGIDGALFFYRRHPDPQIETEVNSISDAEGIPTVEELTLVSGSEQNVFIDVTDPTQVSQFQRRLIDLRETGDSSPINNLSEQRQANTGRYDAVNFEEIAKDFNNTTNNNLLNKEGIFEATGKLYSTIDEFKEDWVLLNGTSDVDGFFTFDGIPNQYIEDPTQTKINANGEIVPGLKKVNQILIYGFETKPRVFNSDYDDGRDADVDQFGDTVNRGLGELLYPLEAFGDGYFDDELLQDIIIEDTKDTTRQTFLVGGCVFDEVTRLPIVGAEVTFGRFRGLTEKSKLRRGPYQRLTPTDPSPDAFDTNEENAIIDRDDFRFLLDDYKKLPESEKLPTNDPRLNYKQLTREEARNLDLYPVKTNEDGCFDIEIYNPLDILIAKAAPIIDKDGQSYNIFQPQSLQDLKDIKRTNKALDLLYNQESSKNEILQDEKDLKTELDRIEQGIYVEVDNPSVEITKEAYDAFVNEFQNSNSGLTQLRVERKQLQNSLEATGVFEPLPANATAQQIAARATQEALKQKRELEKINLDTRIAALEAKINEDPRTKYRSLTENEKQQRIVNVEDNLLKLYENFDASTFLDSAFNAGNTLVNQRRQLAVNNIDSILQGNPLFTATITGSAGNLIDINTPNTLGAGFNAQFGGIAPVTTDSFLSTSLTDFSSTLGSKLKEKNQKLDEILREPLLRAGEYYGVAKDIVTKGLGASNVLNRVGGQLGNKLSSVQSAIGKFGNTKIIIRSKKDQTTVRGSAEDIQQAQEIYNSKNKYVTKRIDPFNADGTIKQQLGEIFMRPRYLAYKINYRQLQYPELFPQLGVAQLKLVNAGKKLQAINGGLSNFRELEKSKRRELIKQKLKRDILPSVIESVLIPLGVVGIDTLLTEPLDNLQQNTAQKRQDLSEFCPKQNVLQQIIKLNNGLKKTVNGLQKAINTANDLVLSGQTLITVTQAAIEIGLFTPYIIAPFSPDTPTKVTGDKIEDFRKKLAKGQLITTDLLKWLIQVGAYLNVFVRLTQLADQLIARCMEEIQESIPENVPIDPDLVALNEVIDSNISSFEQPTNYGNDFLFEIETDSISFNIPRRRAIAKNQEGVILIRGEYSFTSTTDILIEELKYYIKVNNLKAE